LFRALAVQEEKILCRCEYCEVNNWQQAKSEPVTIGGNNQVLLRTASPLKVKAQRRQQANNEPVTIGRNNQVLLWTASPLKVKAQRRQQANNEPVTIGRNNQVLLWTASPLKLKAKRSFEALAPLSQRLSATSQ
jgi:hypothetical protein